MFLEVCSHSFFHKLLHQMYNLFPALAGACFHESQHLMLNHNDREKSENWKFYQTRDDNFDFVKSKIPKEIDVVFIDTLHEADHVEKIIYAYYDLIKVNGYLFIDDISHLPYVKNSQRENFYCEINNKETFNRILEIYKQNQDNFDLEFCFISSGLSIIKKKTNNKLNQKIKIFSKEYKLKNFLRKTWKKIKN